MHRHIAITTLMCLVTFLAGGCAEPPDPTAAQRHPVKLAIPLQPSSALLHVALARGLFAAHGLDVELFSYPSGKVALNDMLARDDIDIVATAEIPFAVHALKGVPLRIIATIYMADNVNRIVARRSAGVACIGDLVGKRLATQRNSAVHYFAQLALQEEGLGDGKVDMVFRPASTLVDGLVAAEYAAFSMREPYVSEAVERLGDDALILSRPGLYRQYELLLFDARRRPSDAVLQRLMHALSDAEKYARANPEGALQAVTEQLGGDVDQLRTAWRTFSLRVELDQSMLAGVEQAMRWVARENGQEDRQIDLLEHIDFAAIQAVLPARLNIIR